MSVMLDLPKDHALRATMGQYNQRFQDYLDECLVGTYCMDLLGLAL